MRAFRYVRWLVVLLLAAQTLGSGVTAQAAAFSAKASVNPLIQYLNDTAGTVFTFTIHNTGTASSIGAVEIARPSNQWTIVACPQAPAGWTAELSDVKCRYRSAAGTADDIKPGQSASTFQLKATTLGGTADRTGTWQVVVSKSNQFDTPSSATAAAEAPGLGLTVHSWQILDAIVDGAPATPGSPCPAATPANHAAVTGSSGHTLVLCGRNRMSVAATPQPSRASLGGTFIASAGAFTSGSIPANSAASVVLGRWSTVKITAAAGSGKTVIARIGSSSKQTSPLTTLMGYQASNQPPAAANDAYATNEDAPLNVGAPGVLANDSDPDGDALTAVLASGPSRGTLTLNANGSFTYTPEANYNGSASFTYYAQDASGTRSSAATVSIAVNAVNDAPTASAQSVSTGEATAKTITLAASDVDGNTLTFAIVAGPNHGTLSSIGSPSCAAGSCTASVTYTPAAKYSGPDSFTFKANDGTVDSNVATVTIAVDDVDDAPTAVNDNATVPEGSGATAIDVLANDTDADGGPKSVTVVTQPAHGTVAITGGGSGLTYTPTTSYCNSQSGGAPDTFTYTLAPGGSTATVSVVVPCVDDAPVAVDDSRTVVEDSASTAIDVLANDTDGDGGARSIESATQPAHGTVAITGGGSGLTYTPAADYCGATPDTFGYKVAPGGSSATVSVTVSCVNDEPSFELPASPNQTVSQGVGAQTVAGFATNISAGPANEATQTLTFHVSTTNTALFTAQPSIDETTGTLTYTPAAGQSGTATVSVYLTDDGGTADGGDDTSATRTFTITVSPPNAVPVAAAQSATTGEDTPVSITLAASDADGDSLSFGIATQPAHGTLSSIGSPSCAAGSCTASVTYTPAANYSGPDSFIFTVNDGTVDSDAATVSITVTAANDAPVADAQSESTAENTATTITLSGSDIDRDDLSFTIASGPSHGTLGSIGSPSCAAGSCTASVTYTPAAKYSGPDSFTFTVNDGTVASDAAKVDITVSAVNDTPTAAAQSVSTNEDTATTITLAASDADDDALTFAIVDPPAHGTLGSIGAPDCAAAATCTASVTYTPAADYNGPDSFTFKVNDGTADSSAATVSITVVAVADPPVLANVESAALSFAEGDPATSLTAALTVAAPDSATLSGATVAISAGYQSGADVLAASPPAGITASFNAATGVLTLTGSAPLADYQTALRSVTFANTSQNPSTAARTIAFKVSAGAVDSNTATRTITVTAVNDAPVNTVPGAQTVTEDTDLSFTGASAISIADVDAGTGSVKVTVSALNGTITPTSGAGATITGSGTSSVSIVGTLTQVNAALNGLKYRGNANYNATRGAETLTVATDDQGNTGTGGALADSDTIAITVTAVNDAPIAQAKSFAAQANMRIALAGLLANASDPDTGDGGYTAAFSVGNVSATAPAGGNITFNAATGDFTFDPPAGATGTVAFNYTVCDSGNPGPAACSAPATVTITVAGPVIWFVNAGAATNGDGRLSSPFNTLGAADAVDAANHRIFLYSGTASGGIALNAGEWLIGQGVTGASFDAVMGITPPAGTIARPAVGTGTATVQGTVTLANSVTVKGLVLATGAATGLTDPAGAITGITVDQVAVTTSTGIGVSLSDIAGALSFSGLATSGGTGANLTGNNSGATFTFTGVAVSSGANPGFVAIGGSTLAITGSANTLASTTGTALSLTNTTIGASGLTFRSISANGSSANAGIVLDNTGTIGGLTVTGAGTTAGSGGTIANRTGGDILSGSNAAGQTVSGTGGTGIFLRNTSSPSFSYMQLNNFSNFAIYGKTVTGFTLANSTINGVNGSTNAGDREEASIRFDNLLGSASIASSTVAGGATGNVLLYNTSGTLDRLTLSGITFGLISTTLGNDNVHLEVFNTATAKVTVQNSTFAGTRADFFEAIANNNATLDAVASSNDFNNGQAIIPGGGTGVSVRSGSAGKTSTAKTTFSITNNTINDGGANAFDTVGIFVAKGQDLGTMSGTIQGNTLVAKSGTNSDGIFVRAAGNGAVTTLIQSNTITGWGNAGIHLQNNDGGATMNASVFGNSVTAPGYQFPFAALFADNGATATDTSTMNLVVGSASNGAQQNTFTAGAGAVVDESLSNFNANTRLNLSKNGSAATTAAGVIADDNVGTPSVDTTGGAGTITLVTTLPPTP